MPETLLVVDDDPAIRGLLTQVLKREGFEVDTAENGADALTKIEARSRKYDAILLDLMMPVMSGFEVLDELDRRQSEQCVLVVSAVPDHYLERVREHAATIIGKPFDIHIIGPTIRKCIAASAEESGAAAAGEAG
jgi:DNA-binding response OmpR family regulator